MLSSPTLFQRLVVEARNTDEWSGDVTGQANFASSNLKVATVSKDGVVTGLTSGTATITARVGRQVATSAVTVAILNPQSSILNRSWSFRNHVLPVLTKAGCNSGACHGATAGKGGLKLTLRGFDPLTDYYTFTRQALARRVDRVEPAQSLMLLKPTAAIRHGGGLRFAKDSLEYRIIRDWIAAGASPPSEADPSITGIEVLPAQVSLKMGYPSTCSGPATQQVLVRAHFSDGHTEDVTRWAKFNSNDTTIATVDDNGKVTVIGSGEVPITVWYSSKVAFATMTVPFRN